MMNAYEQDRTATVRAPLTRRELRESSYDTIFLITELSDAIRRGVCYYSMSGKQLVSVNEVLNALITDGEVAYDDDEAAALIAH